MNIEKKLITSNNKGKAGGNRPRFIVLHDTGNSKQSANASAHYNWLQNTPNTNASAHVFVDDQRALQVIDYHTPAWHTGKLYVSKPQVPDCSNYNSIGIEFCIHAGSNLAQTLQNTVEVVSQLMTEFHIPLDHVITHQMSAGKKCPGTFINNPHLYEQFMKDLKAAVDHSKVNPTLLKALAYLKEQGITNSPEYWIEKAQTVQYLDDLICNTYHAMIKSDGRS